MATDATTRNLSSNETAQTLFVTGLRNAHAEEKQALQMMERQVERYEQYPEVTQILQQHIRETEQQIQRLEDILHALGEDRSLLKDVATQTIGNLAAVGHALSGDEILKNMFANHGLEAHEMAAYTSLITMAEATGHHQHIPVLQQSLREEEAMERRVYELIKPVTLRYLELEARGEQAKA
jgi:ferritin-like metal-binding protein YciE